MKRFVRTLGVRGALHNCARAPLPLPSPRLVVSLTGTGVLAGRVAMLACVACVACGQCTALARPRPEVSACSVRRRRRHWRVGRAGWFDSVLRQPAVGAHLSQHADDVRDCVSLVALAARAPDNADRFQGRKRSAGSSLGDAESLCRHGGIEHRHRRERVEEFHRCAAAAKTRSVLPSGDHALDVPCYCFCLPAGLFAGVAEHAQPLVRGGAAGRCVIGCAHDPGRVERAVVAGAVTAEGSADRNRCVGQSSGDQDGMDDGSACSAVAVLEWVDRLEIIGSYVLFSRFRRRESTAKWSHVLLRSPQSLPNSEDVGRERAVILV